MTTRTFITDDDDPVDICMDAAFKAVFTKDTPASKGALSKLVSALIGRDVTIQGILANEIPIDNTRDRQIRFDINCKAITGELINVEMCLNPSPFEPARLEFHIGKLFVGQDIKGQEKDYKDLNQAYQIAILVKRNLFDDDIFFHTFEYYDPLHEISLGGRTRIITLELLKLGDAIDKPLGEMSTPELWAIFLGYLTDKNNRDKINEIIASEEGIAMAAEVLMTISKDEEERARIMRAEKTYLDWQSYMVNAKREGRAEGQAELLELLEQGLSVNEIRQRLANKNKQQERNNNGK